MKRLLTLLLACILALSLAACGGGGGGGGAGNGGTGENGPADSAEPSESSDYDAKFELFVNGEEEWTPFPGKSGVSFECSKEDILAVRPGPSKVEFTGKQVGTAVITATLDGQEAKAFVKVKQMVVKETEEENNGQPVPLNFTPPTAVKATYLKSRFEENLTYNCIYFAGKSYSINDPTLDGLIIHATPSVEYSCAGGKWQFFTDPSDGRSFLHDWSGDKDLGEKGEKLFAGFAYELIARTKIGGAYTVDDITPYRLDQPQEEVAGIKCDLYHFDPSVAADYLATTTGYTFWVDPRTHYTLKYSSDDGSDYYEILEFDAAYTGVDDMAPASYDHSQMQEAG